jgi:hypothetical protein
MAGAAAVLATALWLSGGICRPAPARADAVAGGAGAGPDEASIAGAASPEVREPVFQFLLGIMAGDSLGVWEAPALQAYVRATGRPTRLPLAHVVRIERRAVVPPQESRDGVRVERIWHLILDAPLDLPMPYSILGYHPGTMRLAREIDLSEWRLGDLDLRIAGKDGSGELAVAGLTVLRLDTGWLILDVDGVLDRLLGKLLDDTWTAGVAVFRRDGCLTGLALGYNRKLRPIFGEFDFRADKVLAHDRPLTSGLSAYARRWTLPPGDGPVRAWIGHD